MSIIQKIIKYCALAFAIFLIVSIFSGIYFGIKVVFNIFGEDDSIMKEMVDTDFYDRDFNELVLELGAVNLEIKTGDYFKISTNNKNIKIKEKNNTLSIIEKEKSYFKINTLNDTKLIVTIPEDKEFNTVKLEAGAGNININSINTDALTMKLGAGRNVIDNLNVNKSTNIECGAGKFFINSGIINNLNIKLGVGKFSGNVELINDTNIEAGVGVADLNIIGKKDDYKFNVETGIGTIKINGETAKNKETIGYGSNLIKVKGGIGTVNINVIEEEV